jgi:hypothetical protein
LILAYCVEGVEKGANRMRNDVEKALFWNLRYLSV